MCLLIFAHRVCPRYPLLVAANRDEFHARPTAPAQFWEDYPQLLAGRDLEQGGTWMGVTRNGRFAAITNYRDPARTAPAPRSRGELPLAYLTGRLAPEAYLQQLQPRAQEYAGFNLLLGDANNLWYFSNSGMPESDSPRPLEPGIYGLSNAQLDTPWPKVSLGRHKLQVLLQGAYIPDHDSLRNLVGDRLPANPTLLASQGLQGEMDQLLSSQFITTGSYGTRSSTSMWYDANGMCHWREQSFDASGELCNTLETSFSRGS
jgi:uncharacterized protein with NRDE domain